MNGLKEVLQERFPLVNLDFDRLSEILLKAAEEGKCRLNNKEDILFFEGEKLLLPKNFYQSQSWGDRVSTPNSEFVMLGTIRHLVKRAEEKGKWGPEYAVDKYLDEIGEEDKNLFLKFFKRGKKEIESYSESKKNTVPGDLIMSIAEELGIEKADVIRGEFKKGGIMSPCSNRVR